MNEPPARICCGQRHWGAICPDGKAMCVLCFERVEVEKLHVMEDGLPIDMCQKCADKEGPDAFSS